MYFIYFFNKNAGARRTIETLL